MAPPMKLTAQQYQECWKERIEKEQKMTAQMAADNVATSSTAKGAAPAGTGADDDIASAISGMSKASRTSKSSKTSSALKVRASIIPRARSLATQLPCIPCNGVYITLHPHPVGFFCGIFNAELDN